MKKTMLIGLTAITVAAMLIGCGTSAPAGSSVQEASKKIEAPETKTEAAKPEPIEVDVKKLPEGITENDLMKDGDSYYLDQTEFKYLAKAAGKDLSVESTDGYEYTANAKGNMVTRVAVTEKKEDTEKKADQKQNGTTASSGTTGTNQTVSGGTGGTTNSGTPSSGSAYSGNSGSTSSGNTSGGSSSGNSGSTSGGGYVAPAQPAQPVHQHTWVAHTTTVDQGWYEDVYEYHSVCNGCGIYLDGWSGMDKAEHLASCPPGSYSGKNVVVGQRWVANPVTVTDYYYCSGCGAIQ